MVGVDEVGRGALAGPVVAGAVVFDPSFRGLSQSPGQPPELLDGVRDSKLAGPKERPQLADSVRHAALAWAVGEASPAEIDALGIARASEVAMIRALTGLRRRVDLVLVDGFRIRVLTGIEQRAIVRGDRTVLSIAAASLVAKVHRDDLLIRLGQTHQDFGFDRHKGYGSPAHLRAIALHGPTVQHRLSWAPLQATLATNPTLWDPKPPPGLTTSPDRS